MAINPKTQEDQEDLNKRLRSLKIDREPARAPSVNNRSPKLLLLALSALVVLVAGGGYLYFSATPKTISAAEVKLENSGGSQGDTVLSASGYVVAHHKIAVGAKVDRKSTRLNSSHTVISYAGFCLKKRKRSERPCRRCGSCAGWTRPRARRERQ